MGSYVPNTKEQRQEMLKEIGFQTIDDLFAHIPAEVKIQGGLNIPEGKTELEVRRDMENIAAKNQVFKTIFRGAGAYRHFIPATVKSVISKENLLTAYTPYQAEISQGILQSIFEYQTMICDLTGMDISNACVYDGAEASAEGVAMCRDRKRSKALVSATVNPYVLETIKTYCFGNEMEVEVIPEKDGLTDIEYLKEHVDAQTACVLIQHPNYYGNLEEAAEIGEITHGAGAKYVMNVNPISLGVVKTPAEYGADVAVGEGQPLGLSIAFGGPYLGFMAATQKMMRNLPGRIVGQTEDHNGKKGYVLTLQAREQHIRREKASSNICSNQALCALAVGVYLATMGNEGIKKAATLSTSKAHYLSAELAKVGYQTENKGEFFHEFVTVSDVPAAKALAALEEKGILGGFPLDEHRILWCCTEVNTKEEMDAVIQILKGIQPSVFKQFKDNPEEFIIKAAALINDEKATAIIEHITYDVMDDHYGTEVFTDPTMKGRLGVNAMKAKKHLYDHIVYDSSNEQKFATELDTNTNVAVYVKLPDGFYISTPVGHYNPDWAIAFYEGTVKHIYFVAETKGSMNSMQLRLIEESKIHCAREHFKAISNGEVVYDVVDSYQSLMDLVTK